MRVFSILVLMFLRLPAFACEALQGIYECDNDSGVLYFEIMPSKDRNFTIPNVYEINSLGMVTLSPYAAVPKGQVSRNYTWPTSGSATVTTCQNHLILLSNNFRTYTLDITNLNYNLKDSSISSTQPQIINKGKCSKIDQKTFSSNINFATGRSGTRIRKLW